MTAMSAGGMTVIPLKTGAAGTHLVVRTSRIARWERAVLIIAAAVQTAIAHRVDARARRDAAFEAHQATAAEAWRYLGARGR